MATPLSAYNWNWNSNRGDITIYQHPVSTDLLLVCGNNKVVPIKSKTSSANTFPLTGVKFKTELLAYNNAYCSWLFQATLSRLSFGTPPPPYRGSKVPCRFLSLDTLWRSHFRPYRGASWPGWLGHFAFRWLEVRGQEPRHSVTVWNRIRWWIPYLARNYGHIRAAFLLRGKTNCIYSSCSIDLWPH